MYVNVDEMVHKHKTKPINNTTTKSTFVRQQQQQPHQPTAESLSGIFFIATHLHHTLSIPCYAWIFMIFGKDHIYFPRNYLNDEIITVLRSD